MRVLCSVLNKHPLHSPHSRSIQLYMAADCGSANCLWFVGHPAEETANCPFCVSYALGLRLLCATLTSPVAQVPVHKLPVVSGFVAAVLFVALLCVLISDAGVRVTEEARVQPPVTSYWSGYDCYLEVVLRMEVVADSSSDMQLSVALLSVIAIQVEGFAVLHPQGQNVGTRFHLFDGNLCATNRNGCNLHVISVRFLERLFHDYTLGTIALAHTSSVVYGVRTQHPVTPDNSTLTRYTHIFGSWPTGCSVFCCWCHSLNHASFVSTLQFTHVLWLGA